MANDVMQFDIAVKDFARKLNLAVSTAQKEIALRVFTKFVKKNPVLTGRSRGSWTVQLNRADRTILPPAAAGTVYPEPIFPAAQPQMGDSIWISNNVPYIGPLERGHSRTQAPNGFIKISVEETRVEMQAIERAAAQVAGL